MRKKDECTHNDHIEVFHRWQISRSKISSDVVRMVHDVSLQTEGDHFAAMPHVAGFKHRSVIGDVYLHST